MKKDIYIIKNTVNNLCYIGQSTDYLTRFRKHKEEAVRNQYKYKSVLYDAMNEFGIDKFYVEVVEENVEDGDDREKYWIKKYNTLYPNGYNLVTGGTRYPNLHGILHHKATIKTDDELNDIFNELSSGAYTISDIAKKHKVKFSVIEDINLGYTYHNDEINYPIMRLQISKGKLDRLTYDLKYSNKSYQELSLEYGISSEQVQSINSGRSWKRDYLQYPLRICVFSDRFGDVEKIQKDLLSTDKTFEEIAKEYGCSDSTVRRINSGETHYNDKLKYPLQHSKQFLLQHKINQIHNDLLNTNKSIEAIAREYNVSTSTIKRINNGETMRYRDENIKYPIRPL